MANWCFNEVAFTGSKRNLRKVKKLFAKMAAQQNHSQCGQLPAFIPSHDGYFFWLEVDEGTVRYDTRWSPNLTSLKAIADRYHVGFTCRYEELGNMLFGKASYQNGILTDNCLHFEDFNRLEFDERKSVWLFEGKEYESDSDILDMLLEQQVLTNSN